MTVEQLLADLTNLSDGDIARRLERVYPDWVIWRYAPGPWWGMRKAALHGPTQATVRAYTRARLIQRIAEREQA